MPERAPDPRVPVPRHRVTTLRPYKRARRDRVWGALGLVFLLVTLYLLFGGWKAPVVRPHGYSVRWEESVHALANVSADLHWTYDQTGTAGTGETVTLPFSSLSDKNVSFVLVVVQFGDDVGDGPNQGDMVNATIEGPDGFKGTGHAVATKSQPAAIALSFSPNVLPPSSDSPLDDRGQVLASLSNRSSTKGDGVWKVTLRLDQVHGYECTSATGCPQGCNAALASAGQCRLDPGTHVDVSFHYRTYHPVLDKKT